MPFAVRRAIVVIALVLVDAAGRADAQTQPAWLERVSTWLTAADQHLPGTEDAPLRTVGQWTNADLEAALPNLKAIVELFSHPGDRRLRQATRRFTRQEMEQLADLAGTWMARLDSRRLLERAALLHTDLAMLPSRGEPPPPPPESRPPGVSRFPTPTPAPPVRSTILLIDDGRVDHEEQAALHWQLARAIVDVVVEDPARDATVLRWYHATAAFMAYQRQHAYARSHLARARDLFPRDATLLLYSGCFSEALTSPDIQNALAALRHAGGRFDGMQSPGDLQEEAAAFFRRALEIDPSLAEARLHLGAVLGARGRHQEAVTELERARREITDPSQRYHAELFLGRELEALAQLAPAREAYERAAQLFPLAQSPHLALSQLARRTGDRAAAHASVNRVLALTDDAVARDDPWWHYYQVIDREVVTTLFAQLRAPYLQQP